MVIISRIATACVLLAGTFVLVVTILMALTWPYPPTFGALPRSGYFGFVATMATIALSSLALLKKRRRLGTTLLWISAFGILLAGFVPDAFTFGLFFIPPAALLVFSAIALSALRQVAGTAKRIIIGAIVGAIPGGIIVLLTVPVSGEVELILGVGGIFLAIVGTSIGAIIGGRKR